MRHSTIFRSRWMALLWAGGILWFAADVASGAKDEDADSARAASGAGDDRSTLNAAAFDKTDDLVAELNR